MILKGIIDTDTVNYKKISMVLEFPRCDWKCDRECGQQVCQNCALATAPNINIKTSVIVQRYLNNTITEGICMQGLEPLDTWDDLWHCICEIRRYCTDDIVIYTGYTEEEVYERGYIIRNLKQFPNIIIKFGRYIPGQEPHYDEVLGVKLASDNQYAKKIS